ncbi:DUF3231 family protein [Barrientosiimonas marina]|uniref:DUF3231 family protein n=1 Tax=Lentibacillus kimchii TaxID=1542911 RepID=A0ABW2UTY8_9BACI
MGILDGNPADEPMHYGEVFGVWTAVMGGKGLIAEYQTLVNHAGDEDLTKLLEDTIQQGQQEVKEMEELLKKNGVGLPPTPPERPKAHVEDIPAGARFMDQEIAASVAGQIAAGLVSCSEMMGTSTREDIARMFGQFHTQKATLGEKYLKLTKDKGWLVSPPLHHDN